MHLPFKVEVQGSKFQAIAISHSSRFKVPGSKFKAIAISQQPSPSLTAIAISYRHPPSPFNKPQRFFGFLFQ
ncbi:MAG: hypothetical protein J6K05_00785 [Bacteroidaceae bacterium]|nr:hypothetical protein [Bacteroidaceae bacterium]